jgi:hypothetical protein
MIFERQRRLLALLDALGCRSGKRDFQKKLFLYTREVETEPSYEFVPYQFGAFSFTSNVDMRKLSDRGFLNEQGNFWILTPNGQREVRLPLEARERMLGFAQHIADLNGDALVAETYRRYPYFAIHSRIAESVLRDDKAALESINRAKPRGGDPGLCTIGYEGRSLENYLNQLIRDGVTILCDVRRNPLSRKYGFSKSTLETACKGVGIAYVHLPELGIASDQRRELKTQADYDALFEVYERDQLPHQRQSLGRILEWVAKGERVALTCYERHPHQCHRHCVAEAVQGMSKGNFTSCHL